MGRNESESALNLLECGTPEWIRTTDLLLRRQKISITYRQWSMKTQDLRVCVVDPDWTQNDRFRGFGPWLDPASTLVIHMPSRARAVRLDHRDSCPKYVAQTGS